MKKKIQRCKHNFLKVYFQIQGEVVISRKDIKDNQVEIDPCDIEYSEREAAGMRCRDCGAQLLNVPFINYSTGDQ